MTTQFKIKKNDLAQLKEILISKGYKEKMTENTLFIMSKF